MHKINQFTIYAIASGAMALLLPVAGAMESASFQMTGGMGQGMQRANSNSYTLQGGVDWIRHDQTLERTVVLTVSSASSSSSSQGSTASQQNNPAKKKNTTTTEKATTGPKPPSRTGTQPATAPKTTNTQPSTEKPAAPGQKTQTAPAKPTEKNAPPSKVPRAEDTKPAPPKLNNAQMKEQRNIRVNNRLLHRNTNKLSEAVRGRLKRRAQYSLPAFSALLLQDLFLQGLDKAPEQMPNSVAASLLSGSLQNAGASAVIGAVVGMLGIMGLRTRMQKNKRKAVRKKKTWTLWLCAGLMITGFAAPSVVNRNDANQVHAAQSVPNRFVYNGRLLQGGNPVTTAHSIRFSYWKSPDAVSGDKMEGGQINESAPNFANWQETVTVTPDGQGYFSVELGGGEPLPDMAELSFGTMLGLYLQVEVKPVASPLTAFELMDTNGGNDALDRTGMLSVPFAINADMVDKRSIGTGSGSIPLLGPGGVLPATLLPITIPGDTFTLDNDDSSVFPKLQFGTELNESLGFDTIRSRFSFSDDVHIDGNLSLSGTINGVDITALAEALGASGATLTDVLHPEFPNALYEGDGSNNTGQLSLKDDDGANRQAYIWTTTKTGMQDYDVVLRYRLPENFGSWDEEAPLTITLKTGTNSTAQNAVSIAVFDTAGNAVPITGGVSTVAANTWTDAVRGFGGTPVWEGGKDVILRFTLKATAGKDAQLGTLTVKYVKE